MDWNPKHRPGYKWPACWKFLIWIRLVNDPVHLELGHDLDLGHPACAGNLRAFWRHESNQILLPAEMASSIYVNRIRIGFQLGFVDLGNDEVKLLCTPPEFDKTGLCGMLQYGEQTNEPSGHIIHFIRCNTDQGVFTAWISYEWCTTPTGSTQNSRKRTMRLCDGCSWVGKPLLWGSLSTAQSEMWGATVNPAKRTR